ncbi:hypothetical protein TNCV_1141231 [Trichonephila clavipes]|nr:hypothetical protein TNCV_1141231 [Trichonephila clavipes]
MARSKGLSPDEIANLLREISENVCESDDSDEDTRFSESYCEESEESACIIDNISINSDIHIAREGTEWIQHNSNVPDRFATKQWSDKLHET